MKSLQGQLLIASEELLDPNFVRTVVLMIQHSDDGAMGLILNRPTETTIKQAWEQVSETPCGCDQPLRLGGPCQGPLMAMHTHAELSDIKVFPGLHFTANAAHVEELIAQEDDSIRFFLGFAGWAASQLEAELETGSWLTSGATVKHAFYTEAELWEQVRKEAAGWAVFSSLNIRSVPADPSLN